MNFLADQNVLVLGLGASGLALARWCVRCGARVTVADTRPADLESPTQSPGVIRSDGVMLLEHEIRGPRLTPL